MRALERLTDLRHVRLSEVQMRTGLGAGMLSFVLGTQLIWSLLV
jgi:hypothetical protein